MVSVYVSYAWKEEAQKPLVEKLAEACAARGMKPRYDRKEMKYGDSIRQFMDEIGAAGHIVLVLSEAYFTSEYCMYELCQIYDQFAKHDQAGFRARVNPVVLSGTPLYNADDRLRYLHHWERRSSELNAKLKRLKSLRHTRHLQDSLSNCDHFRTRIDEILAVLADMLTPSEEVHRDTDFAALLGRIVPEGRKGDRLYRDNRDADGIFVQKVEENVRQKLTEVPDLTQMIRKYAVTQGLAVGEDVAALAHCLCSSNLETVLDDVLRPATGAALQHKIEKSWETAKQLLFWLCALAVRPDWVEAQERRDGEARFEVPIRTRGGAEIVSSRYQQAPPGFDGGSEMDLIGRGRIKLTNLESGFGTDQAVDDILLDLAHHFKTEIKREDLRLNSAKKALFIDLIDEELYDCGKHKHRHHYILVDEDEKSPLRRPSVYDELRELLPRLKILYQQASGENPLLLRETRLITIIRGFLNLPDTLR